MPSIIAGRRNPAFQKFVEAKDAERPSRGRFPLRGKASPEMILGALFGNGSAWSRLTDK